MTNVKLLLTLCLMLVIDKINAFQVYPSTGHLNIDLILDKKHYPTVANQAHGMWLMPWNWRNELNDLQREKIIANYKSDNIVVEIEMGHINFKNANPDPIQLTSAIKSGLNVHTLMIYNEGENGSVLTQENIKKAKALYGKKHKIISNCREWNKGYEKVFSQLDGVSFEFQVPNKLGEKKYNQVVTATKWALANNKDIYYLSPAGHNNAHLNNAYFNGYKKFYAYLLKALGMETMKSDNIYFSPANYNFKKTQVLMGPETSVNTVHGVAKWLLNQAEISSF